MKLNLSFGDCHRLVTQLSRIRHWFVAFLDGPGRVTCGDRVQRLRLICTPQRMTFRPRRPRSRGFFLFGWPRASRVCAGGLCWRAALGVATRQCSDLKALAWRVSGACDVSAWSMCQCEATGAWTAGFVRQCHRRSRLREDRGACKAGGRSSVSERWPSSCEFPESRKTDQFPSFAGATGSGRGSNKNLLGKALPITGAQAGATDMRGQFLLEGWQG